MVKTNKKIGERGQVHMGNKKDKIEKCNKPGEN